MGIEAMTFSDIMLVISEIIISLIAIWFIAGGIGAFSYWIIDKIKGRKYER